MHDLTFLKLGGSLITDKNQPQTVRKEILARLADEIASARKAQPGLRLILGHGSGSFGHTAAKKYATRQGVHTADEWLGFAEVWKAARALNQIVVEALQESSLPLIAFPPSAAVSARDGRVLRWDISPIQAALSAGLIPLVNGDTIFDEQRGGTILSTEDLFIYLAGQLNPGRILLAGIEEGVWADFPACTQLIERITPNTFPSLQAKISGSASVDVTGGMLEKVKSMIELTQNDPGFQAIIFSGLQHGNIRSALLGGAPGTRLGMQ
ncbi:MAG: isopentenyl phosphate kinase family protein [Anaerolineaceae bacterium]|nr:isopentenyl phosphate kinase family protein [Anaerolineaceae bacterium]